MIVPYPTLMAAGGSLKAIAVRVDSREVVATAQELVDRFGLSLFSGEPDGTFLYHASDTMSYSGVPNIIIPLAISVFIVLNTMIGSVYERKREIAVYTSVGLAPSHVSFLFIAEALAFAVLSVVFGYLLAQTTAWLFAGTGVWAGITVNYSSMGGVAAMLLVMAVVLLSAIYPSRVAGQIAIPDVNRSWTLPPASGNTLELVFPFLMTYREHRSVGGLPLRFLRGALRRLPRAVFDLAHRARVRLRHSRPTPRPPRAARRGAAKWTSVCAWSAGCGSRPSISGSCSGRSCASRRPAPSRGSSRSRCA